MTGATSHGARRSSVVGFASAGIVYAALAAANGAGWITLPWAWFFFPVWLPFLAVAALLGVVVVAAWAWLVLVAVWAVLWPVGRHLGRLLAFPACGRALRCARCRRPRSET